MVLLKFDLSIFGCLVCYGFVDFWFFLLPLIVGIVLYVLIFFDLILEWVCWFYMEFVYFVLELVVRGFGFTDCDFVFVGFSTFVLVFSTFLPFEFSC